MDFKQYFFNRVAETNPSFVQYADTYTQFEVELKKVGECCFEDADLPEMDVISEGQFIQICDDTFRDKVTAMRIVALLEWSVRLAEKRYRHEQTMETVNAVADWLARYFRNKLSDWAVKADVRHKKKNKKWMKCRNAIYILSFMAGVAMGIYHSFLFTHTDESHAEFYGNITIY